MARYALPPRQKMINLLYIILIAMLAINVSTDVMTGYDVMYKSYSAQIEKIELSNRALLLEIKEKSKINPASVPVEIISSRTDLETNKLIAFINEIKVKIIRDADGTDYEEGMLVNREDMRAVPAALLSSGMDVKLKRMISSYCDSILPYISDKPDKELVKQYLKVGKENSEDSWEEAFTSLPAIGGVVFFTKLQLDVLQSANEVYRSLLKNMEKVHEKEAFIKDSLYQAFLMKDKVEEILPSGNVSSKLMNILYAGVNNPIHITVPEMARNELKVSMVNGRISEKEGEWTVLPEIGAAESTIILSKVSEGKETEIGRYVFKVRPLPDPQPFISYTNDNGNVANYYGAVPINKKYLLNINSIGALSSAEEFQFSVLEFEVVLKKEDNTTLYESQKGNRLSDEQMHIVREAGKGDRLYITSIVVLGPDGKKREVQPVEIVVK